MAKIKRVLLISCRSPFLDDDRIYPPLANLYLHQAISEFMPEVKTDIIDDYSLKYIDWFQDYQIVGISIMTPQREEAHKLLKLIKQNRPDIKVIAGGPHAKHYFSELEREEWDFIVPYDGIRSIIEILKGNEQRILKDQISAAIYKDVWVKPNRLDNAEFLKNYKYNLEGRIATTMLTAQGCPQPCTFCEDAKTVARWTPIEKIKEELDDILELGYNAVYIFDDLFAIAMPKVKPICEELKKRDLTFRCNGQANYFTKWGEDFAKLLADSGCREIAFGHESGNQTILDNVIKKTSVEQNYKSIEYAKKYGIKVKSFLMLGLPGENYETMKDTERFIATAGMDDFQLAIYYPYKGTQIRDAIDRGDNKTDLVFEGEGLGAYGQKGGSTECVVRTSNLSREDLINFRDHLVKIYKPQSHSKKWDSLFDKHIIDGEI